MSEDDIIDPAGGGNMIAAEYVLGVLGASERREVERRLAHEPELAAEVAFWEERLAGLADGAVPVTPPPEIWSEIEAILSARAARRSSLWESLVFWRGFAIASAALAAASLAALVYVGLIAGGPTARAPLMATIGGASGQPNFVARAARGGDSPTVVPASLLRNDPRAIELWLIPVGETRPRSLGLIQPGQPIRLQIPPDLAGRVTADATLAVSLEPPGGSPTGLPTRPVIPT